MHLFFAFVAFLGFVVTFGFVAGAGVGWRVGILSKYFIGNNVLLKLPRIFSLALINSPKLFKKDFFSSVLVPFSKFFNTTVKLLCLLSDFSNDKYP